MSILDKGGPASYYYFDDFKTTDPREIGSVFHYTSTEALVSILTGSSENIQLRFTRINCLNDYSEGSEAITYYKEQCNAMYNEGKIDKTFYEEMQDMAPSTYAAFGISGYDDLYACDHDVYVCCFSKNYDSLPMWNYYLRNNRYNGFNIGIDLSYFNNLVIDNARFFIVSVIYDDQQKQEFTRKYIQEAYENYLIDDGNLGWNFRFITSTLTTAQYMFKNKHSKHEEEIRVLMYIPKSTDPMIQAPLMSNDNIAFMSRDGLLIPYKTINIPKNTLTQVTVGPLPRLNSTPEKEMAIEIKMLKELLLRNGYSTDIVKVINSSVPARY